MNYTDEVRDYCTTRRLEGARVKVVQAECRKHFGCEPSAAAIGAWLTAHRRSASRAHNLNKLMRVSG